MECNQTSSEIPTTNTPMNTHTGPWWKDLVTGKDGKTHDLGRWSWAVSTASILILAAWHEHKGIQVGLQELGISLGAVVTAHGAALGFKNKTEPDGDGQ